MTEINQEKFAEIRVKEVLQAVKKCPTTIDKSDPKILAWLDHIYKVCGGHTRPDNIAVMPPKAALNETGAKWMDGTGVSRIPQLEHYRAALDLKGTVDEELMQEREFAYSVFDTICGTEGIVLVPWPSVYETLEDGRLHCADGPSLVWEVEGFAREEYDFWNGTSVPTFSRRGSTPTKEQIMSVTRAEQRRAVYERLGFQVVFDILELVPVDSAVIRGLEYQLFRSSSDESWLKMQSPELQDGSQPFYIEPVHEGCESCEEALGWRATGELGVRVEYGWEA